MTVRVDPGNVQGNVLRSYGREFSHTRYVFVEFEDAQRLSVATRRDLARALDKVSFGTTTPRELRGKDPKVNVAFTYRGLAALGLPADTLEAFPDDFRLGAKERAKGLGDHWQDESDLLHLDRSHLMISIHTPCADEEDKRHDSCKAKSDEAYNDLKLADPPFRRFHVLDAGLSPEGRERFGFSDGFSQPAVEGVDIDAVGKGVYVGTPARGGIRRRVELLTENVTLSSRSRGWRPIRTGEFLLGFENEDGNLPIGPPLPLGPNSTFLVYREFDQDVHGFKEFISRWATLTGLTEDELKAKIVGRWTDGSPAVRFPFEGPLEEIVRQRPCPACGAKAGERCTGRRSHIERIELSMPAAGMRFRANDFHYRDDASGWGCPLGAHVRRANPRDTLAGGAEQTMRHRIIRRGMPFIEGGDRSDASRQGLAFVCLSASIEDGFEFIQRNWINSAAAFGLGSARDFLLQEKPEDEMVIQGYRPIILKPPDQPFVRVRGCEYFFVPSRVACAWLAALLRG